MFRWLMIGVAVLTVMAAQHGATGTEPYNCSIDGKWSLVRSCGGFFGGCTYPEFDDPDRILWFSGDSSYAWYVGSERYSGGYYHLELREIAHDSTAEVVVFGSGSLSGFPYRIISFVSSDTLILSDPCCDGFADVYHKVSWEF
jgi:hypothetical protein